MLVQFLKLFFYYYFFFIISKLILFHHYFIFNNFFFAAAGDSREAESKDSGAGVGGLTVTKNNGEKYIYIYILFPDFYQQKFL